MVIMFYFSGYIYMPRFRFKEFLKASGESLVFFKIVVFIFRIF